MREIFLASILTRKRSKEEILKMYLNEIYYGNLAYGIEAAAQTYFGKPAAALTVGGGFSRRAAAGAAGPGTRTATSTGPRNGRRWSWS